MTLETDLLLDRRRLKRRLFAWRTAAILAVAAAAAVAFLGSVGSISGRHVARLSVTGIITEDRRLTQAIASLAADAAVPAVILYVNSPGGTIGGGESLHAAIARVAAAKPVVAVMGGTAASAGYMIALPATRIFARDSTLTGSIGVYLQTGEISALLNRIGVSTEAITSGPLKDQPSLIQPLTPLARDVLQALVMDMYDQFVSLVAKGRHLSKERVRQLADGRAYTGRQALDLGLIDQIGGEPDAREWLERERGISSSLPIEDVTTGGWAERQIGAAATSVYGNLRKIVLGQGLNLDGAWSLWQPAQD